MSPHVIETMARYHQDELLREAEQEHLVRLAVAARRAHDAERNLHNPAARLFVRLAGTPSSSAGTAGRSRVPAAVGAGD
jgi:hypothetical protein